MVMTPPFGRDLRSRARSEMWDLAPREGQVTGGRQGVKEEVEVHESTVGPPGSCQVGHGVVA